MNKSFQLTLLFLTLCQAQWASAHAVISDYSLKIALIHAGSPVKQAKSAFPNPGRTHHNGCFSLVLACGRWLELKLDKPGNDIARLYFCCRPVSDWHHPDILSRTPLLI